jgi:hypothetical protein
MMITQELECKENISQDVIFPPSDLSKTNNSTFQMSRMVMER